MVLDKEPYIYNRLSRRSIMLDIYHFSNPLSTDCLKTEERLLQLSYDLSERVHLRFIPLLDHHLVAKLTPSYLRDSTTDNNDQKSYHIAMDYKAAQVEGNKKARRFLINLQHALTSQAYSLALVTDIAETARLNVDDFLVNREATETFQAVLEDQALAKQMLSKADPCIAIDDPTAIDTQLLTNLSIDNLIATFAPHCAKSLAPDILRQHLSI